ncbi:MAG TPA: LAGLIDADG family homing endonuclease [Flavobacteriaceae bacterium]|nr:LAGLIDADG family homing endonuclease [Flavobacteriaceae bacterium]
MSDKFTINEALEHSLEYFQGNELAASVFVNKYSLKDNDGSVLEPTPHEMHQRLAAEFARIDAEKYGFDYDKRFDVYFDALKNFARIVLQGSPMSAVGNKYQRMSASNCVVVQSPKDSVNGIFASGTELAELYKRRCGVGIDISTLRPDGAAVNNAARTTSGAWSFANFYSDITRMIGQCIAKDERVLTDYGLQAIQDISPGDKVWTKKGFIPVKKLWSNGIKKIFKLETTEGFSIKASMDHIFLTEADGRLVEKRLGEFELGDSIVLIPGTWRENSNADPLIPAKYIKKAYNNSNRLNEHITILFNTEPTEITQDLAYLLGQMYGDGYVQYDKFKEPTKISIACAHPAVQNQVCKAIKNCFGIDPAIKPGDGALSNVHIHSKIICNWLALNGLLKEKSNKIKIPTKILKAASNIQMSFLAGFFDADGTNGKFKKGYVFTTTSFDFASDIQTILMSNGIISKRHVENRQDKGWKDLYTIAITGSHAQKALVSCIEGGSFPAIKIYEKFISKRDNYLTPYKASSLNVNHNKYKFIPDESQYISANAYLQIKQAGEDSANDGLLIKSSVQAIIEFDEEETFDLELPEEHLFWCEGFYVHNSARRGALMITMDIHHPDVIKFSTMKHDLTKVTGANISVRLSDEFLQAVEDDTEYEQRWPCEGTPKVRHTVPARMVWETIINSATKTAEPGLILWGNMLRNLPAHCYPQFKTISTNPCSEIALSAYDSCRLISLNLTGYVRHAFKQESHFDFDAFKKDAALAMQMADNLVDIELELIDRIKEVCGGDAEETLWNKLYEAGRTGRRTGLGTHGLGDTLAQLGIKYDSKRAIQIVEEIYETLRNTAYETSINLAEVRGAFPAFDWEKEKDCTFFERMPKELVSRMATVGRRNISLLTQAPTGSVSIISKVGEFDAFNVSSGVEPVFRNSYTRRKKINSNDTGARVDFVDVVGDKWQEYKVFHSNVKSYLDMNGLSDHANLPDYFVTSDQIDWRKRIEIQSAEQKFIDHSISSTINLPTGTSSDVVGALYLDAWKKGLKGVTVYVDGSRDGVLVEKKEAKKNLITEVPKRPDILASETHKIKVDFGDGTPRNAYVTVSFFPETRRPYEIFVIGPYQGLGEQDLQILELTARTTSMNLRHGVPIRYICEQFDKIGGQYVFSIPTNIAKLLSKYSDEEKTSENMTSREETPMSKCPNCKKRTYVLSGGCGTCVDPDCAYSGCS